MVFPVVMYVCESWTIKKSKLQRIDAFKLWLEKTLESPLVCKEIQPVNPEGNQSWIFIGRTDAEAEDAVHWQPDGKGWFTSKDPDARRNWGQKLEGGSRGSNEMIKWHHWLKWHEFGKTLGDSRTEDPDVLQSMGPQRVRLNDWATTKYT